MGKRSRAAAGVERLPLEERARNTTLSTSLGAAFRHADLKAAVLALVRDADRLRYWTWLLCLVYFAHLAETNVVPPDPDLTKVFTRCWRALQTESIASKDDDPLIAQLKRRLLGARTFSCAGAGNVIKYEATKYQTAVENYAACMDSHYKTFLKAAYPYLDRGWKRDAFLRQVEGSDAPVLPANITEARFTEDVAHERANFRGVKDNFATMLLFRRKMLSALQTPDDKRFSLLPLPSIGLQYVTLDLETLQTVSTRFRKTNRELYDVVHAEATTLDMLVKRPSMGGEWTLGSTFSTNGVELHTLFEKNVAYNQTKRGKLRRADPVNRRTCIPEDFDPTYEFRGDPDKPLIGVDIGHHNFLYGVASDSDVHVKFSKRQYDDMSLRREMREVAEKLTKRAQHLLVDLPTLKVGSVDALILALGPRVERYDALYAIYANRQVAKRRFFARTKTESAMDTMINALSSNGQREIGWGDCSKTSGFRGLTPGGPVKHIRRRAVARGVSVTLVNEYRTSKSSLCCPGADNKRMYCRNVHRAVHGVSICQGCGTTWNRDVVGASNILLCFTAVVRGEARPAHLAPVLR